MSARRAEWELRWATRLALWSRPWLLRWSDRTWVRLLRVGARLVPAARPVLHEAIEVLEAGPPGTTLLRQMVSGTTDEELRDLLWGLLAYRDWGEGRGG